MKADHEKTWDEFWKPLCTKPDGTLDIDAIKRELHDFHTILGEVPKVYDHVTHGRISKANTLAFEVIAVSDDIRTDEINEALKEYREQVEGCLV